MIMKNPIVTLYPADDCGWMFAEALNKLAKKMLTNPVFSFKIVGKSLHRKGDGSDVEKIREEKF